MVYGVVAVRAAVIRAVAAVFCGFGMKKRDSIYCYYYILPLSLHS